MLDQAVVIQKTILESLEKLEKGLEAHDILWEDDEIIKIEEGGRGQPVSGNREGTSGEDLKSVEGVIVDSETDSDLLDFEEFGLG